MFLETSAEVGMERGGIELLVIGIAESEESDCRLLVIKGEEDSEGDPTEFLRGTEFPDDVRGSDVISSAGAVRSSAPQSDPWREEPRGDHRMPWRRRTVPRRSAREA